jgi:hypothetical protein
LGGNWKLTFGWKKTKTSLCFLDNWFYGKKHQVVFSPYFWLLKVETFQNYFIIIFFLKILFLAKFSHIQIDLMIWGCHTYILHTYKCYWVWTSIVGMVFSPTSHCNRTHFSQQDLVINSKQGFYFYFSILCYEIFSQKRKEKEKLV